MESLSGDVVAYLAGFLGVRDVVRLGAVSRRMQARVAANEALWQGLACRLLGSEAPKTRQVPPLAAMSLLFFFFFFFFLSSFLFLFSFLFALLISFLNAGSDRGASGAGSAVALVARVFQGSSFFVFFFFPGGSHHLAGHLFVDGADVGRRGRAPRARRGRGLGRADGAALADGPGHR